MNPASVWRVLISWVVPKATKQAPGSSFITGEVEPNCLERFAKRCEKPLRLAQFWHSLTVPIRTPPQVVEVSALAAAGQIKAEGTGPATADFRKVLLGHDFCKKS
jgi:hypothetical protein